MSPRTSDAHSRVLPQWRAIVDKHSPAVLIHGNAQPSHFIKAESIVMLSPDMQIAPGLRDIVRYLLTLMLSGSPLPFDEGIAAYATTVGEMIEGGRERVIRCSAIEAAVQLLTHAPTFIAADEKLGERISWLFSVLDVLTAAVADSVHRLQ